MTHDEFCSMKERVFKGIDMVMQKAEHIGREHKLYSIDELCKMSDICKDCAEGLKDLAKANYYINQHGVDRY